MRKYRLERNANGMITQCENADGGNIYAQREEINKKAMENLQRPTPGKLGELGNLQIFNFELDPDITPTVTNKIFLEFNTTNAFPANATQTIMFGVPGTANKAQYYNIVDVKASVYFTNGDKMNILEDSYIEFYILQNIETSTTSLGTKIPQPAPLSGNGGGAVTFTTTGNEQGHQYFKLNLTSDNVNLPSNSKGLRASGLALKTIFVSFNDNEDIDLTRFNIQVFVDTSSVSQTF